MTGGVGQQDADLAVLRPARGPRILPLHPGGADALLDEPGLISDQDPAGVPEVPGDVVPHVITDVAGIPATLHHPGPDAGVDERWWQARHDLTEPWALSIALLHGKPPCPMEWPGSPAS
jgi:hypothetical protein